MIDLKSTLKTAGFMLIAIFIVSYSLFEFRWVIMGPIIELETPRNGESFSQNLLNIKGKTANVFSLSLNDRAVTVDTEGGFEEKLILSPGYNIMKLEAKDRFGRSKEIYLEIINTKS